MCTGVNLFTLETVSDGAIAVTTQKYLPMFFALHSKRRGRTLLKIPISKNVLSLCMICFFKLFLEVLFSKQWPATTVSNFEATQDRAGLSVESFKTYRKRNSAGILSQWTTHFSWVLCFTSFSLPAEPPISSCRGWFCFASELVKLQCCQNLKEVTQVFEDTNSICWVRIFLA